MARLRKWLQRHLGGSESGASSAKLMKAFGDDEPPFLESPRPRLLTPSPRELSSLAPQASACCLFTKVPCEIRQTIMIMAFGGRTIHMDLTFDLPLPQLPLEATGDDPKLKHHARIHAPVHSDSQADGDKSWRWGGCICHRQHPDLPQGGRMNRFVWNPIWSDQCMRGLGTFCKKYKGGWPDKCRIGIMGFLLSCRQAYAEGIQVLYATNCIHISGEILLDNLPRCVLPQRLATISSLELIVKVHSTFDDINGVWHHDLTHLKTILDALVEYTPNLGDLRLSLIIGSPNGESVLKGRMFPILDAFYESTKDRLRETRIELSYPVYQACEACNVDEHPLERTVASPFRFAKWRCFDGETPVFHWRSVDRYPRPPLQLPTEENKNREALSLGYWLSEGDQGPIPQVIQCS